MKAFIRDVFNATTDVAFFVLFILLAGTAAGIFLGVTFGFGFAVFNACVGILL